uniref:Si:dkeyp-77h1.4 n=1 Tax=Neogobius melanostomus TaxID=47308 RepID=A0A8C6V120_9GOBI
MSFIIYIFHLSPVAQEETVKFQGEDFHISLRSLNVEVTFRNISAPRSQASDEPLMRGGKAVSERAQLNSGLTHLIIESVREADEGLYTIKDPEDPDYVNKINLIVRDCSNEESVKYGDNYHIPLLDVSPPITLEYRPISVEANLTSKPALVLMTAAKTTRDGYQDRIIVSEKDITLRGVTGADEGSYAVREAKGGITWKMCLNVRGERHHHFLELPLGKRMKINLILSSSLVQLHYTRSSDPAPRTPHLLLDKGNFTSVHLDFEGRISLEGNVFILDKIKPSDAGEFKVTDILGFTVTIVHLELKPFKLEKLYVAIIALLAFVVFLLLACLVSCLFKVRKRAKKNAALEKLGLEVSSKEVGGGNLETSDSGVGFNTALPLDTDTDAADALPDSEAASITAPAEPKPSPLLLLLLRRRLSPRLSEKNYSHCITGCTTPLSPFTFSVSVVFTLQDI